MTQSSEAQTTKWNIGAITFEKIGGAATVKKNADQKEDRFKPLPVILPSWKHEDIPKSKILYWVTIGMLAACWLLFPAMFRSFGPELTYTKVISSLLIHPRIALMWVTFVGFIGFCIMSWSVLSIQETVKYAPPILVILFGTSLSGLRQLNRISEAEKNTE